MRRRARSLFAKILDNDDGPRVETVHSFCQSILRRFPIEAGVAPHVQLADDDEQSRLKAMARANILYHPSPELAASVLLIAEAVSEGRADEIVNDFINRAEGLESPDCLARIESHFRDDLGVVSAAHERDVLMARLDLIQDEKLRSVSAALQASDSKTQIDRGAKMDVWLAQTGNGRIAKLSFLVDALFSAGKARKNYQMPIFARQCRKLTRSKNRSLKSLNRYYLVRQHRYVVIAPSRFTGLAWPLIRNIAV